jgi:hypothetical protein
MDRSVVSSRSSSASTSWGGGDGPGAVAGAVSGVVSGAGSFFDLSPGQFEIIARPFLRWALAAA